jgi:hypothetical protein
MRKYFDICEEEKELANTASDQSRLLGRGPRDPGRLLREEKMRKRVKKEKPRVGAPFSTSNDAGVLTEIIARKGPPHLHSRMGSGGGSPFSCAWGKHAANSAQRNRRCRQGKPCGRETTCGFGAATDDNAKLCTWKGRNHTSRAPSVKHGLFTITIGAEQKTAAGRDQWHQWHPGSELRTPFRGWAQRRRRPSTKQDRDAGAGARILRPARTRASRSVRHYSETTRRARDRAPAFETTASAGVECRLGTNTTVIGIVLCAKRRLRPWHIHVAEPTDDCRQSEARTERELPSTAEWRLEGSFPGAIWRFGGRCAERRGRRYMIDRADSGTFLSLCAPTQFFFSASCSPRGYPRGFFFHDHYGSTFIVTCGVR